MATYLILNLVFIAAVLLILRIRTIPYRRVWLATLVVLLVMTAVFDNIMILFDIIDYNTDKLLGLYIGVAPIEDFFYSILAVILIPVLWQKLGKQHAK